MQSNFWWKITKKEQAQLVISGVLGAILCVLSTTVGNFILIEIRFNILFSAEVFWINIYINRLLHFDENQNVSQLQNFYCQKENLYYTQWTLKQKFVLSYAAVIILSGFTCFYLYFDQEWHQGLNFYSKIPLFVILGMSLNSTICYLIVDLINFFVGLTQKVQQRTIMETPNQIVSFIVISTTIGFLQGLIFSVLDIEDVENKTTSFNLVLFEELLLSPFIVVLGCLGGLFNEYLRLKGSHLQSYTFEPIRDQFTDEI